MRRFWIVAVVWVAFWSLYPTFGRPRAFHVAIRAWALAQNACDWNPGPGQPACYRDASELLQRGMASITLRGEYAGYAPVWFGVGVGLPLAAVLLLVGSKRRGQPLS